MGFDKSTLPLLIEMQQFLYHEAELLDEYKFDEWLELFAEDVHFWIPIRRNVKHDARDQEFTKPQKDISWFEESKDGLERRVRQIHTGMHWAEEPLSRTCHVVSNVQLMTGVSDASSADVVDVKSRFIVYRNRVETETDIVVGKKEDRLVRNGSGWKIKKRKVILDQNVLLTKNLSFFI